MSRRKPTSSVKCHHEGCPEYGHFSYDTLKEQREGFKKRSEWKCSRHTNPEEVLSTSNLTTSVTMKNIKVMHTDIQNNTKSVLGMFWNSSRGFVFGDGYKAYAKDFPEGTELTITATIKLP